MAFTLLSIIAQCRQVSSNLPYWWPYHQIAYYEFHTGADPGLNQGWWLADLSISYIIQYS